MRVSASAVISLLCDDTGYHLVSSFSVWCGIAALAPIIPVAEPSNPSRPRRLSAIVSEKIITKRKHFQANEFSSGLSDRKGCPICIRVYFHVICENETPEGGNLLSSTLGASLLSQSRLWRRRDLRRV